jgi:two-component system, NtrC family, response regulator AtoC
LQVVPIFLPPLRDRTPDILLLAAHFISYFNHECHKKVRSLSKEMEQILRSYSWPGNVRELRNVIERAMILDIDNQIEPEHLPREVLDGSLADSAIELQAGSTSPISLEGFVIPESGLSLDDMEHALVRKALVMVNGNQAKAAHLLKMPRDAFRRRMKHFGII